MSEDRKKVNLVYQKVKEDLYLCRPDLRVGDSIYNAHLLFGLLTQLNNGTQLAFGPYGGGKTTSATYLNSIFYGLPLKVIRGAIIRGNPQITKQEVVGRPDYGKLNLGEEAVRWQKFCMIPPKIWDELPRTPESTQSIALAGIEEGSWVTLNEHIFEGRRPFYATANFADRGSNTIVPALLDRFDVATVVGFPGVVNARTISRRYNKEQERLLEDDEISEETEKLLLTGDYRDVREGLPELRKRFFEILMERGVPILAEKDKKRISGEIEKVKVGSQAEAYCTLLTAELNIPSQGDYLRNLLSQSCESRRLDQVIVRYAQSLAWLDNRSEVTLEEVLNVAPYALWHRVEWKDNIKGRGKFADYQGSDLDLRVAKTMLNEGSNGIDGLKKRLVDNSSNMEKLRELIEGNDEKEAKNLLDSIHNTTRTHPYFLDVKRELEDFVE